MNSAFDNDNLGIRLFATIVRSLQELCIESDQEPKFWTDGYAILSKDERAIDGIADLIDQLADYPVCATGYYDEAEDRKTKCVDEYTGFYYVHIAD